MHEDKPSTAGKQVCAPGLSAALIGLDDGNAETLSLLLEILGWSCMAMAAPGEFPDGRYHLVFVAGENPDIAAWLSQRHHWKMTRFAVVGTGLSADAGIGGSSANTFLLRTPLDLESVETVIGAAM